jgi:thiosulfate/3-mercaptopyruvate sulfurtransferase
MKKIVCAIIALLFFAVSFASSQPVAASPSEMLVSTDQLAASLIDPKVVILHVGFDRKEYDSGHIKGARFVLWKDITVTRNGIINQLPPVDALRAALEKVGVGDDMRVIVYGDAPLPETYVYYVLDYLGHSRHSILDGSLDKWKAEKRPVDKLSPTVAAGKLTPKLHPELVVDLPTVQKIVSEKKIALIDARPPDHYSGAAALEGIPRGGHIPGAKNVFWMQTLASKTSPKLKSATDIKALYEAAGLKVGEDVLVYCRTGLMATHDYFTLKLAGFRPMIYNASFTEWSNTSGTPVETVAVVR